MSHFCLRDLLGVLEVGADVRHTTEHLVVYLLGPKVVFHGDLIAWYEGQSLSAATPRATGMFEAIVREKLQPEVIIGAWPVRGWKPQITWSELAQMVELARSSATYIMICDSTAVKCRKDDERGNRNPGIPRNIR